MSSLNFYFVLLRGFIFLFFNLFCKLSSSYLELLPLEECIRDVKIGLTENVILESVKKKKAQAFDGYIDPNSGTMLHMSAAPANATAKLARFATMSKDMLIIT